MSDTVPSSEDLLAAWREAETQQERDEILADMEVDEIEAGWMATNGMPFAGEVSGGGRGASLNVPKEAHGGLNKELMAEYNGFAKQFKDLNNAERGKLAAEDC